MASRSSGAGAIIALVMLGVTTLTFFVLTLYFYGQLNAQETKAVEAEERLARFIAATERDQAERLAEQVRGSTVFASLSAQLSQAKSRLFGQPQGNLSEVDVALADLGVEDYGSNMLDIVRRLVADVRAANTRADEAEASFGQTVTLLEQSRDSYNRTREQLSTAATNVQSVLGAATGAIETYKKGLEAEQDALRNMMDTQRTNFEQRINALNVQIQQKDRELAIANDQIRALRRDASADRFTGPNEASLIDGSVISTSGAERTVTIDRGRRHRIVLGMQFEVYQGGMVLRPDQQGNLPRGKAKLEVINVQENTAVCRILEELRGNPVVRGDVIVNPLYDPNKVYTFYVYGNFAPEGPETSSIAARDALVAQIRAWGGRVVETDDLPGDLDFLILGARPILPPEPGAGAPLETRLQWIRARQNLQKYDDLYNRAVVTSVPILNYNRLRTLLDY
ncbi:MAG: hypothetical protein KF866_05985 [Phycisphaeraceae bacterium]|nr:hypothetical protein [Phycisphaeraceae bacterium]MCW5754544.1 hypothetical protein [Phycisphaeraceae bacterium]